MTVILSILVINTTVISTTVLIVVVSDFLQLSFVSSALIKRKTKISLKSNVPLSLPSVCLDACSDAAQPRRTAATSWPQQERGRVSLRSHELHLLTPVFYSHHLLSVFISFLIFASLIFPFPTHSPPSLPVWLPFTSSHLPLPFSFFLCSNQSGNRMKYGKASIHYHCQGTYSRNHFKERKKVPHTLKVRTEHSWDIKPRYSQECERRQHTLRVLGRLQFWQVQINTALPVQTQETRHSLTMQF